MALNPLLLLRKSVPKILKCRNFRGNQSEREGAGLACDADQNESTLVPKMMGFELSLKKIARSAKLQECSSMIPTPSQTASSRAQRNGEQVSRLLEMKDGPIIHAIVFRQRLRARSSRL
jgi:hypothetical protein